MLVRGRSNLEVALSEQMASRIYRKPSCSKHSTLQQGRIRKDIS